MSCTSSGFLTASNAQMIAKANSLIWQEICTIQQAILTEVANCNTHTGGFSTVVAGSSPFTFYETISSIAIANAGTGYDPVVATITFDHADGSGALGTVHVAADGTILSVDVDTAGSGYNTTNPLTLTFVHPVGTGATATAEVDQGTGEILSVTVTDAGINYGPLLPTVEFNDPLLTGTGAAATLSVNELGALETVTLTNPGMFYSAGTTASVVAASTSPGASGALTVTVNENTYGTDPSVYYKYLENLVLDKTAKVHINEVVSYFSNLGYYIVPQVNPTTNQTIQWYISWS